MNVEEQMYKMCTKCFDTLPFKMFYNYRRNYDGKTGWCKQCTIKSRKALYTKKKTRLLSYIQENQNYFNELPFKQ